MTETALKLKARLNQDKKQNENQNPNYYESLANHATAKT